MKKACLLFCALVFVNFAPVVYCQDYTNDLESEDFAGWQLHLSSEDGFNVAGTGDFIEIGRGSGIRLHETSQARSGHTVLKVTYEANEDIGQAILPIAGTNYVRTSQYLFFNATYDFAFGEKIHRIYSTDSTQGTVLFDLMVILEGKALDDFAHGDMTGMNDTQAISIRSGLGVDWGAADSGHIALERERWYELTTEVQLNDAGFDNGWVRLYLDDLLIAEKDGIQIRVSNEALINSIHFGGWYSNGAAGLNPSPDPFTPTYYFIDDVSVRTTAVPEPSGVPLLLLSVTSLTLRRR